MVKKILILFNILTVSLLWSAFGQTQPLVIMHTNDTHSQIDPYSYKQDVNVGGVLRREAAIREVRAENPYTLLLDAGDFSQGTPYFNFFKGYMEVHLMNAMHYDAATLGNHEFDNGSAALAARLKTAEFPVVCANYQFANKKLAKIIKPYVIIERGGHKIGIFGLGVNLDGYTAPQNAREVTYLDPVETARKMVAELKSQNCDLIVCLSHLGVDTTIKDNDFEIARQVPEIDVIVGGHSHEELNPPVVVGNTRICQMTNRGKTFGVLTIDKVQ
jgi:5'-nucleotidase